eukprot:GHVT01029735.1.p2 GENE.GHVT01029735.1~~GHVT01029735.1.p2  ORF type:complete len:150 (-),score=6.47 GHVT01029735.1:1562-2011(-)
MELHGGVAAVDDEFQVVVEENEAGVVIGVEKDWVAVVANELVVVEVAVVVEDVVLVEDEVVVLLVDDEVVVVGEVLVVSSFVIAAVHSCVFLRSIAQEESCSVRHVICPRFRIPKFNSLHAWVLVCHSASRSWQWFLPQAQRLELSVTS